MRGICLAILAPLTVQAGPATAQEGGASPFGEFGQVFWVCKDRVERGGSTLSGDWMVGQGFSKPGFYRWEYAKPVEIDDYKLQSTAKLSGFWSSMVLPDPFRHGSIYLEWDAPRRLPGSMLLSFGGDGDAGEFTAGMRRSKRREGFASLRVWSLLQWAGDRPSVRMNIYNEKRSKYLGSGDIPTGVIRDLRGDFDALGEKLKLKAAAFEANCERQEEPQDEIFVN